MISLFGPYARYQGLVGVVMTLGQRSFTIHIFPRSNVYRWGFSVEDAKGDFGKTSSFDLGPLFAICWSKK